MDDQDRTDQPATAGGRARRLEERRHEVLAQLVGIDEDLSALRRTREGLSDDDEHDPDGVPLSAQWDRLEGLKQAKLAALAAIEQARERAASGTDGVCEVCGRPIAAARLAVRPEATTCIDCAA
jgi:DnaK suppressor protein